MMVTEIIVLSLALVHYMPTYIALWHTFVQGNVRPLLTEKKALGDFLTLITQGY